MKLKNLHMALAAHPEPRYLVAKALGKPASWMFLIVRGDIKVKPEQQAKLASILGRPVDTLFPKEMEAA